MTRYFVSRHTGAKNWAKIANINTDGLKFVDHLNIDIIQQGDVVFGTLPVHLAGKVCEKGGRYVHLSMTVPQELRGKELTPEEMRHCSASLQEFVVNYVSHV